MESEKVKEIKKALEDNANYEHHDKLGYIDGYKCKTVAYTDILALINELEKENAKNANCLKQFAERLKEKAKGIVTGESVDVLVELLRYSEELVKEYTNENGKV